MKVTRLINYSDALNIYIVKKKKYIYAGDILFDIYLIISVYLFLLS